MRQKQKTLRTSGELLKFAPAQCGLRAFALLKVNQLARPIPAESKAIAESGEYIVIGCVLGESEERVYVHGKIWRYLINQTHVECARPFRESRLTIIARLISNAYCGQRLFVFSKIADLYQCWPQFE